MRSLRAVRVLSDGPIRMRIPTLMRHTVLSVLSEPEFVAAAHSVSRTASHIGRIAVFHSALRLQRLVVTARIFSAVQLRADPRQRRQRVLIHLRRRRMRRDVRGLPRQIVFEAVYIEIVEIVPICRARCIGRVLCLFLLLRRRRRPKRFHMRLGRMRGRLHLRSVARRHGLSRRRRR